MAARKGERPPSGRLFRRLLVATLLPTLVVLAGFGFLAHEIAQRSLEEELGRRLATAAAAVVPLILPQQITAIGPGDEGLATAQNLLRQVDRARKQLGVRRVALVARDLSGRADTEGRVALGAQAHELSADRIEIDQAVAGTPSASPLFWGHDGLPYKRAYAAVGSPAVGLVVVEGSADYFLSLAAFRRTLATVGAIGLCAIILVTMLLARRITKPLARLARAAEGIGAGDLGTTVPVETRDEIGFLAARLDEMREALRARDERLQMMLAGIAHEVRNPLGGLELYAGLLRDGLGGQEARLEEVARIEREVGYLGRVVAEFLDYARRSRPEPEPVPLRPLLDEVAELCAGGAGRAPPAVDAPDSLEVRADRGQLRRALINLAHNAAAAAGAQGRVTLAARRGADGRTAIEVRDSGPGVPEDLREKIFIPFFTTREKGTGLGLAFVRDIVRDHGGEVALDRAPEGGARFTITLPPP